MLAGGSHVTPEGGAGIGAQGAQRPRRDVTSMEPYSAMVWGRAQAMGQCEEGPGW